MKAPPESTKTNLRIRLNEHARRHWPGLASIDIRYRANFAYIDGRTTSGHTIKLCRLRYGGSAHLWGFAIYRASHDDYEDNYLPTGHQVGTAEAALDCAASLYIGVDLTQFDTPTN